MSLRMIVRFSVLKKCQSHYGSPCESEQTQVKDAPSGGLPGSEVVAAHGLQGRLKPCRVNGFSGPPGMIAPVEPVTNSLAVLEIQVAQKHRHRGQSDGCFESRHTRPIDISHP
jgi:hypothetical protein